MPYVVIKFNDQEIDRRELSNELVVGRAPECGVAIRDILLSRRHCFLEEGPTGWLIADLNSKNGTFVNGEKLIGSRLLQDVDVIRMGRSKIIFHAGIPDESVEERLMAPQRPIDPSDSMSGTLSGFTLLLPGEGDSPAHMPCPRPTPKQPTAYESEEVQILLTALASSSWDSIYAEARQPRRDRPAPAAVEDQTPRPARPARPRSPIDFSLQASPTHLPAAETETESVAPRPIRWKRWIALPRRIRINRPIRPSWRKKYRRELPALASAVWILAGVMLIRDWPMIHRPAPQRAPLFDDGSAVVASAREIPSSLRDMSPPIAATFDTPTPSISAILDLDTARDVKLPVNLSHLTGWPIRGAFHFDFDKPNNPLLTKDAMVYLPVLF